MYWRGGLTVGWDVSGVSMGSGSTRVCFRDGGETSITFGGSAGGEGALSTSGGVSSSEPLVSGGVVVFFNSENGEARMISTFCWECHKRSVCWVVEATLFRQLFCRLVGN